MQKSLERAYKLICILSKLPCLNIYYEIRMNWLNLTHTLTNTQAIAPKDISHIITHSQNQKYLKLIPMGHHPSW